MKLQESTLDAHTPRQPDPAQHERILRITVWTGLAALFFSRISSNIVDLDIWHEMSTIRASLAAGHLITTDLFAYTPTLPVTVDHEWGAGAIAYFLAHFFGAGGILLFKLALGAGIAALALPCNRSRGAGLANLSVLAPASIMFLGVAFSPIRGHLYSVFFTALLFWMLERDRRGGRRWIVPWLVLFPLWVNLHGGFVVGIGLTGIYAVEQAIARKPWLHILAVIAAMSAAIMVNPFGASYYSYLWRALTMKRPAIGEWLPLWQAFPSVFSVVFLVTLALVVYAAASRRMRLEPGIGAIAVTAAATAMHQRMFPFYALAFLCYAPGYLERTPLGARLSASFQTRRLAWQAVWTGITVFFLCIAISYRPWKLEVPGDAPPTGMAYPTGAVNYLLRTGFRGNIMTPFECGAYVSWRMYPAARVSVDSRYEVAYPNWWVDQSFRFYEARPGWRDTLKAYPTDLVLVRRTQPLAAFIAQTGWRRVYADRVFEIYERNGLNLPEEDHPGLVIEGRFP